MFRVLRSPFSATFFRGGLGLLGVVVMVWALQQDVRGPNFLRAQTGGVEDVETWNAIGDMKVGTKYPNYLWSIAYGAGKFVAVGDDGKGTYSADGITWTAIGNTKFPAGYSIRSITYGAGKFVAVGDGGKGAYSSDGITWTAISDTRFRPTFMQSANINAIAYGNGKFVAVGQGVASSVDGITWTAGTIDAYGGDLRKLAYGAGKFLAMNGAVMGYYSTDGITWNQSDYMKVDGDYLSTYTYGADKFVALGESKGAYSTDGINWIRMPSAPGTGIYRALTYGNGKFVLVRGGGTGAYSADGITWTEMNDTKIHLPLAVAYGAGRFVAVGHDNKGAYSGPAPVSSLSSSSQQSVNCSPCTTGGGCQTCAGNGRLCAIWNSTGDDECLVSPLAGYTVCSCSAASSSSSSSTPPTQNADISVIHIWQGADGASTQILPGQPNVQYWVSAGNSGPTTVANTVVTVTPAPGLIFDAVHSGTNCQLSGGVVRCTRTNVIASDWKNETVTFTLPNPLPSCGTTLQTTASISTTGTTDPDTSNNQKTSTLTVWCAGSSSSSFSSSSVASSSAPGTMTWNAVSDMKLGSTPIIYDVAYGDGKFVAVSDKGAGAYSIDGANWTAIGMRHVTNSIQAITYGNGRFVAVGGLGRGSYSTDGVTWTGVSDMSFGTSTIYDVVYGNGKFVAVGIGGKASYSTDGVTWTAIDDMQIMAPAYLHSVAYGNGRFVAVGGAISFYSTDGVNWTRNSNTKFGSSLIRAVTYGNGKFVAVGEYGKCSYSTDGVSWTAVEPFMVHELTAVTYGNDRFVVVSGKGNGSYSADGVNWTFMSMSDMKFGMDPINGITYGNDKFVAVGWSGKGSYSGDAVSVSSSSSSPSIGGYSLTILPPASVSYMQNAEFTMTIRNNTSQTSPPLIVELLISNGFSYDSPPSDDCNMYTNSGWCGGDDGYFLLAPGASVSFPVHVSGSCGTRILSGTLRGLASNPIPTQPTVQASTIDVPCPSSSSSVSSDESMVWHPIPGMLPLSFTGVAYGNGKFVAVSHEGRGAVSVDGANWTEIADMKFGTTPVSSVAFGNGVFVAVGQEGKGAYSTDGVTWTLTDMKSSGYINYVGYGGGKFIAVGDGGKGSYSTDGITWTAVNMGMGTADTSIIAGVTYGNGRYVAGGYRGIASTSTDGISWTAVSVPTNGGSINTLAYGAGRFVAMGDGDFRNGSPDAWTSTDGINWTAIPNMQWGYFYELTYGGGRFIASYASGKAITSLDGLSWTEIPDMKMGTQYIIWGLAYGAGKFVAVGVQRGAYSGPPVGVSSASSSVSSSSLSSSFGSSSSSITIVDIPFSSSSSSSASSSFSSASPAVCGNFSLESGEECEIGRCCASGYSCDTRTCECTSISDVPTQNSTCGNYRIEVGEDCEDGISPLQLPCTGTATCNVTTCHCPAGTARCPRWRSLP